jgi:hypothetical protein
MGGRPGMGGAPGMGGVGGIPGMGGTGGMPMPPPGGMLQIVPENVVAPIGSPIQYRAYIVRGAISVDVTAMTAWSIEGDMIATIAPNGVLTGAKTGRTRVRAMYMGQAAVTNVTLIDAKVVSITIAPATASIDIDQRARFTAVVTYSNGMMSFTQSVIWSSSDEKVATISNTPPLVGYATGVGPGKAAITASFAGVSGQAVIVVQMPVTLVGLRIDPGTSTVPVGEIGNLMATGTYSDGSMRNVTLNAQWTSKSDILTVAFGRVRCNAAGTGTVVATLMNQTGTATVTCGAIMIKALTIIPSSIPDVPVGTMIQAYCQAILPTGMSADVTNMATWMSENAMVATVDRGGGIRAAGAGMTNIDCTYAGMTAKAAISVVK